MTGPGPGGPSTASSSTLSPWWMQRPIWELVPALFLVVLVAVFGRFERPARPRREPRARG